MHLGTGVITSSISSQGSLLFATPEISGAMKDTTEHPPTQQQHVYIWLPWQDEQGPQLTPIHHPPLASYPSTPNTLRTFSAVGVASQSFSHSPNRQLTVSSVPQETVPCPQALGHWTRSNLCSSLANELQRSGSLPWARPSLSSSLSP